MKTAERFVQAWKEMKSQVEIEREKEGREKGGVRKEEGGQREEVGREREREVWYVDLNAVSPGTARGVGRLWEGMGVRFLDGGVSDSLLGLVFGFCGLLAF